MSHLSTPANTQTNALVQLGSKRTYFLRFLRARVQDDGVAEDILQSSFLQAHAHAHSLQSSDKATAWFFRILRNALIDHYRREAARQKAHTGFASQPFTPGAEPTHLCACIHGALLALPPAYREAIRVVDLHETSVQAFAEQQQTTANNASVRLHRAHKALHRKMLVICGACATTKCRDCSCQPGQV